MTNAKTTAPVAPIAAKAPAAPKSNTFAIFQAALVKEFGEGTIVTLPQMEAVVFAATNGKVTCAPAKYRSNKAYKVGKGKWIVTSKVHGFTKAEAVVDAAPPAPVAPTAAAPIAPKTFSKVSKNGHKAKQAA